MIRLFGSSGPDHAMADPKAAKRILEELPQDAFKALEELGDWHESVALAQGFAVAQRVQLLLLIDLAGRERVKKITRQYLLATRQSAVQEKRLWVAAHGYWRRAGLALAQGVELFAQGAKGAESARAQLAPLLAQCLHAQAQQIKWSSLRYGPVDPSAWGMLNRVYAFAEARGVQAEPKAEYLRALAFGACAAEGLLPAEIAVTEQLIARLAGAFRIEREGAADLAFWTDLQQAMPPSRIARAPQPAAGLRFFGVGAALGELEALAGRTRATRAVPADLELGVPMEPDEFLALLGHLARNWSPQAPDRRHPRHSVKSRLGVANGLEGVIGVLGQSDSLAFDGSDVESWVIENVSAGGFGALVSQLKGDWLRVGAMVAVQPEGGKNWVIGLVRRVSKTASQQARVGIETLSRAPVVSQFALSGAGTQETGVLLRSPDPAAADVSIALRPGVFVAGRNLEAEDAGRQHVYMPMALALRGEDYEIGRFRGMVRDA